MQSLGTALAALTRHLLTATGHDYLEEVERLQLTLSQIKAMNALAQDDAPTLRELGGAIGLSLPGTSRAVEGLVKRGLVKRAGDHEDRRCKRVTFTPKGRRTFEGLLELRIAGIRRFVEGLEDHEREALAQGLEPLLRRPEIASLAERG